MKFPKRKNCEDDCDLVWAVYELETGFMDGWYTFRTMAEGAVKAWHSRRKKYHHYLIGVPNSKGWDLTSNIFLADVHDYGRGGQPT